MKGNRDNNHLPDAKSTSMMRSNGIAHREAGKTQMFTRPPAWFHNDKESQTLVLSKTNQVREPPSWEEEWFHIWTWHHFFKWKLVCLFHFLYYYAQIRLKVVLVQLCRYTERLGFVFLFPVRQFINKPVSKSRLCCSSLLLNILWGIRLCCQPKLSSCICRTGNRIAAKQLQFHSLSK